MSVDAISEVVKATVMGSATRWTTDDSQARGSTAPLRSQAIVPAGFQNGSGTENLNEKVRWFCMHVHGVNAAGGGAPGWRR